MCPECKGMVTKHPIMSWVDYCDQCKLPLYVIRADIRTRRTALWFRLYFQAIDNNDPRFVQQKGK